MISCVPRWMKHTPRITINVTVDYPNGDTFNLHEVQFVSHLVCKITPRADLHKAISYDINRYIARAIANGDRDWTDWNKKNEPITDF